jgi:hypothetical protein
MGAVSIAVLARRGNCGDAIQLQARFGIAAIFAFDELACRGRTLGS